jgi:hypothetical protein
MTKAKVKRTDAQLQQEFEDCAGELATAIKALIRGYLPEELRGEPFTVEIGISHGEKKGSGRLSKRKGGAA